MFEERPGPESIWDSPNDVLELLRRLNDDPSLINSMLVPAHEPIAPLSDQEAVDPLTGPQPIMPLSPEEQDVYPEPAAVGEDLELAPKPEETADIMESEEDSRPRGRWQKICRGVGRALLPVVGVGCIYVGGKPYVDQWLAARDLAQKSKVTPSFLPPSAAPKVSPSPSALPTLESPTPTPTQETAPELLSHPINAQWLIMTLNGKPMQVPIQTKAAEYVKNRYVEGQPELLDLPSPEGTMIGPDGKEYSNTEFVTRWDAIKVGTVGPLPAIITGHNWGNGAAVFDYLNTAKEGDIFYMIGPDDYGKQTRLTYIVVKTVEYSKSDPNAVPNMLAQMPKEASGVFSTCNGDFVTINGSTGHKGSFAVGAKLVEVHSV